MSRHQDRVQSERAAYAKGYQDALRELLAKWQDEDVEAALAYIYDNLGETA